MTSIPAVTGLIDNHKQPEYTGENRCVLCVVVNLAIAIILVAILVSTAPFSWPTTGILAMATFALFATAIYLRWYLVPGTSQLTETYLPDSHLKRFDHHAGRPASIPLCRSRRPHLRGPRRRLRRLSRRDTSRTVGAHLAQ